MGTHSESPTKTPGHPHTPTTHTHNHTATHHNPTRQRTPRMPTNRKGRSGRPWNRVRNQIKALYGNTCHLCGGTIPTDDQLRYGQWITQPWNHPLAWTAHHLIELQHGGEPLDPNNIRPAHRRCNSRITHLQTTPQPNPPTRTTSQDW